jgi:hypothetical protein
MKADVIPMGLICAWCKTTIREGSDPFSHGICDACADVAAAEADTVAVVDAMESGCEDLAESLYRLRALWIGGLALPWGVLTDGQRQGYRNEVERLVKEIK